MKELSDRIRDLEFFSAWGIKSWDVVIHISLGLILVVVMQESYGFVRVHILYDLHHPSMHRRVKVPIETAEIEILEVVGNYVMNRVYEQ